MSVLGPGKGNQANLKYAYAKYDEYAQYAKSFPICRICNEQNMKIYWIGKICNVICTEYATNMKINMWNM